MQGFLDEIFFECYFVVYSALFTECRALLIAYRALLMIEHTALLIACRALFIEYMALSMIE